MKLNRLNKLGALPRPLWGSVGEGVLLLVAPGDYPTPDPSPQGGGEPAGARVSALAKA